MGWGRCTTKCRCGVTPRNLGGTGGGGPQAQDVVMLTPVAGSDRSLAGATVFQGELEDLHPGFRNHGSVVLHRHATGPEMPQGWKMIGARSRSFKTATKSRCTYGREAEHVPRRFNPGAGAHRSDSGCGVLRDAGEVNSSRRVSRKSRTVSSLLERLRLGRFGWKGPELQGSCNLLSGPPVPTSWD